MPVFTGMMQNKRGVFVVITFKATTKARILTRVLVKHRKYVSLAV